MNGSNVLISNPYVPSPRGLFYSRAALFCVLVLGISVYILGISLRMPESRKMLSGIQVRTGSALELARLDSISSFDVGIRFIKETKDLFQSKPEICSQVGGRKEVDQKNCDAYEQSLWMALGFALAPFIIALFVFLKLKEGFERFFKSAVAQVTRGKAIGIAVCEKPIRPSFTYWIFALRAYRMTWERNSGILLIPENAAQPSAGLRYALFDGPGQGAKKVYFGVLYAPHVGIFKG